MTGAMMIGCHLIIQVTPYSNVNRSHRRLCSAHKERRKVGVMWISVYPRAVLLSTRLNSKRITRRPFRVHHQKIAVDRRSEANKESLKQMRVSNPDSDDIMEMINRITE